MKLGLEFVYMLLHNEKLIGIILSI